MIGWQVVVVVWADVRPALDTTVEAFVAHDVVALETNGATSIFIAV
jgi:hypothetical protein